MSLHQSDRRPRPVVGWLEEDVHTGWRRYETGNGDLVRFVKRMSNHRERKWARAEIRDEYRQYMTVPDDDLEDELWPDVW